MKPLDSTLDFVMRSLEGEHAKSKTITEIVRSSILERVKEAMTWKQQLRSQEEIEAKVFEMNAMMSDIVSKAQ